MFPQKCICKSTSASPDLVLDGVDLKLKTIALDGFDLKLERQVIPNKRRNHIYTVGGSYPNSDEFTVQIEVELAT